MTVPRIGVRRAFALITLVLTAGAAGRVMGAGQTPAPTVILSRAQAAATPRLAPPLDPWELRARQVSLNPSTLANRPAGESALTSASQVVIDLFDGASITAVLDRYDPNNTGVTWVGHVPAQPGSLVTIVHGGGALAASIILPDASYTIRPAPRDPADPVPAADGSYRLVQTNGAGFQREGAPVEVASAPADVAADVVMADTAEFIDVMVAYTALAEAWAGGQAGIINWINVGMSETNSAYAASGVDQRVRLVHTVRVAYTEVGNLSTNLTNLRGGFSGLDTIAALRNSYTADLVTMFVHPAAPDACGVAFLMTNVATSFAPNGFSVVDAPCVSPNGTLAHEFGHNMGLRHDWFVDAGLTPFTYAHGYVNTVARFRTVMSYPDACLSLGFSCTRLLAFSNPDLISLGQPRGIPGGTNTSCTTGNAANISCDADERRALNNTAATVANFREYSTLRPPTILAQPQSQSTPRGQALTLQVTADGLGPLTYQWYRGTAPSAGQPIAGATGPSYTWMPGGDGVWFERWFYWVQVRNAIGTENSLTATVTMLPPAAGAQTGRRSPSGAPFATRGHGGLAVPVAGPVVGRAPIPLVVPVSSVHDAAPQSVPTGSVTTDVGRCQAAIEIEVEIEMEIKEAVLAWLQRIRPTNDAPGFMVALAALIDALAEVHPACDFRGGAG